MSFLVTDREIDGGGFNRVAGPDFQWRPNDRDVVSGQILYSMTETPDRTDLWETWDGRHLSGTGADFWWSHTTRTFDFSAQTKIFGDGFRAECGFVPQVGFREGYAETGRTWHPTGFLSRVRTFAMVNHIEDHDGALLRRLVAGGVGMDGRWNSFGRFWLYLDQMKAGADVYPRRQFRFELRANPSQVVSDVGLDGIVGEEMDIENARPGEGASFTFGATLRAGDHLAMRLDAERRWLDVQPDSSGPKQRLFTASVERVKATWTFNARSFLRLIGQWDRTTRDPLLYTFPVPAKEGAFAASALFLLQAQLAVGPVPRVRGRQGPRAGWGDGKGGAGALPEGVLRVSAVRHGRTGAKRPGRDDSVGGPYFCWCERRRWSLR